MVYYIVKVYYAGEMVELSELFRTKEMAEQWSNNLRSCIGEIEEIDFYV